MGIRKRSACDLSVGPGLSGSRVQCTLWPWASFSTHCPAQKAPRPCGQAQPSGHLVWNPFNVLLVVTSVVYAHLGHLWPAGASSRPAHFPAAPLPLAVHPRAPVSPPPPQPHPRRPLPSTAWRPGSPDLWPAGQGAQTSLMGPPPHCEETQTPSQAWGQDSPQLRASLSLVAAPGHLQGQKPRGLGRSLVPGHTIGHSQPGPQLTSTLTQVLAAAQKA